MTVTATQIARAKARGIKYAEELAAACDKYNFRFYLGCVILYKETSGGDNIYGHDRGGVFSIPYPGRVEVTEENFKQFLAAISKAGSISNGVGPMQITYKGHFPIMEKAGLKAWVPADNIMYGISLVAGSYRKRRDAGDTSDQAFQRAATIYNLGSWVATWAYGIHALKLSHDWRKWVGTEDFDVVTPDKVTPPITPVPPAEPSPVPGKPVAGSKTEWVRVSNSGSLNASGNHKVTTRGLAMYLEAGRLFRIAGGGEPPLITQGGKRPATNYSAGTHGREAMDWSTKSFSRKRRRLWEYCTWVVGFATWAREFIAGLWPAHTHGLPKGGDLSEDAVRQVEDFYASKNALKSHSKYPRIAAARVQKVTWESYRAGYGVSFSALENAIAKRIKHDDVKDLQWALSRELDADLAIDGDPGSQTKTALAKAGGLNKETLEGLGLAVLP